MCQCIFADCWWCNCCDTCMGVAQRLFCIGFWLCRPDDFPPEVKCCTCFQCTGYGGNFCCYGAVCCSPQWLRIWAKAKGA